MKKIWPLFISLLIANSAFSQTEIFEVFFLGHQFGIGARALSMGGAFTAVADDYTATYWNPAGLAQIRRMEFLGAMSHLELKNEANFQERSNTEVTNVNKLNAIGFVFPYPTYRGSLVFAIGYNRIRSFDSGSFFNGFFYTGTDTAYQKSFSEIEDGGITNWVVSGAIDVTEHISIGLTLNIWRGNDDYQWMVNYDSEINKYYFDYNVEYNIKKSFSAINFKLGALYRLGILGRVGIMMETPITLDTKEDWTYKEKVYDNYDPEYADYSETTEDNGLWDYSIKAPLKLTAGGAFTLFPNLIIAGDVEYNNWTQLKYTSEPPYGDKTDLNIYFRRNYRATTQVRVGAEFTVPFLNWQLRAGFMNKPLPYKDANAGSDRRFFTAGAGFLLDKQVKLDITWLRGWWEDQSTIPDDNSILTEKIRINKILATVAFRF